MRSAAVLLLALLCALSLAEDAAKAAAPAAPAKNGKSVLLWTFPSAHSHSLVFAKVGRELAARGYTVRTG